jgi:N-acetylglutamate synthase-like GNAT family acetyltransferase
MKDQHGEFKDPPLVEQLLYARELFYYSSRYRNQRFGVVVTGMKQLSLILDDLTVVQEAGIPLVVLAPHHKGLRRRLTALNSLGYPLRYGAHDPNSSEKKLRTGARLLTIPPARDKISYYREALSAFRMAKIRKVFVLVDTKGLEVEGKFHPHPDLEELSKLPQSKLSMPKALLDFFIHVAEEGKQEVVFVQAASGEIFQEIFTHRGAGTMLSVDEIDEIRLAKRSDVRNIFFLLHPYLRNDLMRPITPNEILRGIKKFLVYTINDQLIASLKIDDHGEACEIGKVSALPRYQNRGRAGKLIEHAVDLCRKRKKKYVFALTTQASVGDFFLRQGFESVKRELLPESWKKHYDFSRPSKAYRYIL